MINLYALFIVLFLFINCADKPLQETHIKGIQFTSFFPYKDTSNRIIYDSLIIKKFWKNDLIMYKFNYQFDSLSENIPIKHEIRTHIFIYQKDSLYGYNYDPFDSSNLGRHKVDSLLKADLVYSLQIYPFLQQYDIRLVSSHLQADTLKELYNFKAKNDTIVLGELRFLYSSKFNQYDYSLSPQLDSIKKMRLINATLIDFKRYDPITKEFMEELSKNASLRLIRNIPDDIKFYFSEYEKQIGR